jgi:hypothetical protein
MGSKIMPISKFGKRYLFDKPGNYRIRVQGILNESWSDRLGGLRISACSLKDQEGPVTELFGKVRDQAALAGLLNSLYELHLTLLSVEYLNGD